MEKPLKIRMHIISPVHIGCGDAYEPTSFVIDEKSGKLIEFDPLDFISSLSPHDKEQFASICMEGTLSSIIKIYRFISDRKIQIISKGRQIEIAADLKEHYNKVKKLPLQDEQKIEQELNKFAISRTAYNPHTNLPYIPGTSVKGALRTAYLSKLAKDKGIKEWWTTQLAKKVKDKNQAKEFEKYLLDGGSFDTDPFRLVKVSDFLPLQNVKTKIMYAVNRKKKKSKFEARGPFQIVETIQEGAVFEGIINIQKPPASDCIKKPIKAEELLHSVNAFYVPLVNEENKVTYEIGAGNVVCKRIKEGFKLNHSSVLIRLGRHSGAEAVTIEGNRHIKIMQGKGQSPRFLPQATTLWLASEKSKPTAGSSLVPFGWAVLEVLPA